MSALVERIIAARDGLKGLNISDYALIREARDAMADAANALTAPTYDGSKSLGERLHAAYREALGHQDGERSNFTRLPADDQAFWDRAAVNFVARLSS